MRPTLSCGQVDSYAIVQVHASLSLSIPTPAKRSCFVYTTANEFPTASNNQSVTCPPTAFMALAVLSDKYNKGDRSSCPTPQSPLKLTPSGKGPLLPSWRTDL